MPSGRACPLTTKVATSQGLSYRAQCPQRTVQATEPVRLPRFCASAAFAVQPWSVCAVWGSTSCHTHTPPALGSLFSAQCRAAAGFTFWLRWCGGAVSAVWLWCWWWRCGGVVVVVWWWWWFGGDGGDGGGGLLVMVVWCCWFVAVYGRWL